MMRAKDVWTLLASEKFKVECNQFGQPIKKAGGILGGWLGTVARRENMCPIHYISWKIMPTDPFKLKIINVTRSKFSLPGGIMKVDVDGWILKSVSKKWKDYKYDLKAKSKINEYTQQEVSKSVPPEVVPQQWIDLVRYWYSEKSEKYSKIGTSSRKNHTTPHTTGSKSFARKRDEFV